MISIVCGTNECTAVEGSTIVMLNFELFEIHVANPLSVCMYMWNPYQQTKGRQGGVIPGGALPPLHFRQLVRLEVWFPEE